jgi:hypothetical protein
MSLNSNRIRVRVLSGLKGSSEEKAYPLVVAGSRAQGVASGEAVVAVLAEQ